MQTKTEIGQLRVKLLMRKVLKTIIRDKLSQCLHLREHIENENL